MILSVILCRMQAVDANSDGPRLSPLDASFVTRWTPRWPLDWGQRRLQPIALATIDNANGGCCAQTGCADRDCGANAVEGRCA